MKCIHLFFLVIVLGDKACWLKYLKEINESDGFDITDFPGCGPLTTIFPMTPSKETKKFAEQALELYNEDNALNIRSMRFSRLMDVSPNTSIPILPLRLLMASMNIFKLKCGKM